MEYEWDDAKSRANFAKHGVPFETVETFDWQSALVLADDRRDYSEIRHIALGGIGGRLHVLVFTVRGRRIRVISLRKANMREIRFYEQNT